jgi:hypothetical protein
MDRNAVLLHQENSLFRRYGQNDGGTGVVDPTHVFPMAFFDQSKELARMQDGLGWSVRLHVEISALYARIMPSQAVSARGILRVFEH